MCHSLENFFLLHSTLEWIGPQLSHLFCHRFFSIRLPLFLAQKGEICWPSVWLHLLRCHVIWRKTRTVLLRSAKEYKQVADRRHRETPHYVPYQKVWLSSKNIPLKRKKETFLGTFIVDSIINTSAVKLKLPTSKKINYSVSPNSSLSPPTPTPCPDHWQWACPHGPASPGRMPPWEWITIGGWLGRIWFWSEVMGTPAPLFWTITWSETFTGPIQTSLLGHLEAPIKGGALFGSAVSPPVPCAPVPPLCDNCRSPFPLVNSSTFQVFLGWIFRCSCWPVK